VAARGAGPPVEQIAPPPRCTDMMASWSPASTLQVAERRSQPWLGTSVETAFREALVESLDDLPLGDRNLIGFHYFHGLGADQLAEMFSTHRAAVVRQLGRIRERLLRDTRRGLAARLPLHKDALDRVLDVARGRFDVAIARVLRA
jgi:DNA-directed RNA polymerase specialized sigma24 family protein